MRIQLLSLLSAFAHFSLCATYPSTSQQTLLHHSPTIPSSKDIFLAPLTSKLNINISLSLFAELEELSRVVDISYCVSTTGIQKPFVCASRCDEFPGWELVGSFDGGSGGGTGYVVLDHEGRRGGKGAGGDGEGTGRILVVFRGTYSFADTIVDLSTKPQEYVPYPSEPGKDSKDSEDGDDDDEGKRGWWRGWIPGGKGKGGLNTMDGIDGREGGTKRCDNCTVHSGFFSEWKNTRPFVMGHMEFLKEKYPDYSIHVVGHSLGGAIACLAGLEFDVLGWKPTITTFGEPKVGNEALGRWIDGVFEGEGGEEGNERRYRRVTHVDDPVPLLPLGEWGYRAHSGEVYISKLPLQPSISDLRLCYGPEDKNCISKAEVDEAWFSDLDIGVLREVVEEEIGGGMEVVGEERALKGVERRWGIPARYKVWQLFFAHRDYFWRLGLCVPGGDPLDWGRDRYKFGEGGEEKEEL